MESFKQGVCVYACGGLVVGGPQFQGDGDEAGAQRDGEASEAAAAGAEGTAAGPSGKNREEKWMLQT